MSGGGRGARKGLPGGGEAVVVGVGMTRSVGYSGGGRFMVLGVACV